MYCLDCGKRLRVEDHFCQACGARSHFMARNVLARIVDMLARVIVVGCTPFIWFLLLILSIFATDSPHSSQLFVMFLFGVAILVSLGPFMCAISPQTVAGKLPRNRKIRYIFGLLPVYSFALAYLSLLAIRFVK